MHRHIYCARDSFALNEGPSIQHEVAPTKTYMRYLRESAPRRIESLFKRLTLATLHPHMYHRPAELFDRPTVDSATIVLARRPLDHSLARPLPRLSSPDNNDPLLSADWMGDADLAQISELARIRTRREEDHPTLGSVVKFGLKDEEAFEVLQLLVGVLNDTGRILQDVGLKSL